MLFLTIYGKAVIDVDHGCPLCPPHAREHI
jgi:hypothetical protein